MADKISVEEAVNLANQDTAKLSNEQLTQMNEAFADSFFNKEPRSADVQTASAVTIAEIDSRLEALAQSQNPDDEQDLDSIIAMAESVGIFAAKQDIAKEVLDRAKKQKAELDAKASQPDEFELGDDTASGDAQENQTKLQDNEQTSETQSQESPSAAEDSEELSEEENQALETAENTAEDPTLLAEFDAENGIDKVSEEQLEANDKILDKAPHPFAMGQDGKLLNPEMQESVTALQNLTITDEKGEKVSDEEQRSAKADLVEAAMLEAGTQARIAGNGKKEDTIKLYNTYFQEALQRNIVAAAFASDVKKGMTKEQLQEKFTQVVNNPQTVKKTGVRAVLANSSAVVTKLKDRLKAKFKSIPVVKRMEDRINAFDEKMTKRYGKKYKVAKRLALAAGRSLKNVGIYAAIGATAGPVGLTIYAAFNAKKAMKSLQQEAAKNDMSLKDYAKANKLKVGLAFATTGLAVLGSAVGFGTSLGVGSQDASRIVQPILRTTTRVLAIAPKAGETLWHGGKALYEKIKGNKEAAKQEWDKTLEAFARTSEAAVGIAAGSAAAPWLSEWVNDIKGKILGGEDTTDTAKQDSSTQTKQDYKYDEELAKSLTPHDILDQSSNDADHDGIPDSIDKDAGYGWANEENYTEDQKFWDERADQFLGEQTTQDLYARIAAGEIKLPEGIETPQEFAYKLAMAMEQTPAFVAQDLGISMASSDILEASIKDMTPEQFAKLSGLLNDFSDRGEYQGERVIRQTNSSRSQAEDTHLDSRSSDGASHGGQGGEEPRGNDGAKGNEATDVQESSAQDGNENQSMPEPVAEEKGMSEKEQALYNSIYERLSQSQDMSNPEVAARVAEAAQANFDSISNNLKDGNIKEMLSQVNNLHKIGEHGEVLESTQADENDSRKMENLKEKVQAAEMARDKAQAALDADSTNKDLEAKLIKAEKEFDLASLEQEKQEIKEERSDLKDQIKADKESLKNLDKFTRPEIEENTGWSEKQVNQELLARGFDPEHLPEDRSALSAEDKKLFNAKDQYNIAQQDEDGLKGRIADGEKRLGELDKAEEENKANIKEVKKGLELDLEAQNRVAGQTMIENSEILRAAHDLMVEYNNPPEQTAENVAEQPQQETQEVGEPAQEEASISGKAGEISYSIDENGHINMEDNGGKDAALPEWANKEFLKARIYEIRTEQGISIEDFDNHGQQILNQAVADAKEMQNYASVCADLEQRAAAGEQLSEGAKKFMDNVDEQFARYGLQIDENGNIVAAQNSADKLQSLRGVGTNESQSPKTTTNTNTNTNINTMSRSQGKGYGD